jgi:hypothetical protein
MERGQRGAGGSKGGGGARPAQYRQVSNVCHSASSRNPSNESVITSSRRIGKLKQGSSLAAQLQCPRSRMAKTGAPARRSALHAAHELTVCNAAPPCPGRSGPAILASGERRRRRLGAGWWWSLRRLSLLRPLPL